jgi:hypothetical protein
LIFWRNSEDVDEGHHVVVLRNRNHMLSTSWGFYCASSPG